MKFFVHRQFYHTCTLVFILSLEIFSTTQIIAQELTSLFFHSESGDFIGLGETRSFSKENSFDITASPNFDNGISFSISNSNNVPFQDSESWSLDLSAPFNAELTTGIYENATRWPFQENNEAGLDFSGDGRGCNTLIGSFTISEANFDTSGSPPQIISFAARFEQHCGGGTPALVGMLNFKIPDSDQDGLSDNWEVLHFGNLTPNAGDDADGDSITNLEEFNEATDPQIADSDRDGLPDDWELLHFGELAQNPNGDPDGDGISNFAEFNRNINPNSDDSDMDGLPDGWEIRYFDNLAQNPADDPDGDGITNLEEFNEGRDPNVADSDRDGLPDDWELQHFGDLTQNPSGDPDNDRKSNVVEFNRGTDPNVIDSSLLYVESEPGDYIGGGQTNFYNESEVTISVSSVQDRTGDSLIDYVSFNFGVPSGSWSLTLRTDTINVNLEPGFFDGAERAPFADPGHPGLSFSGHGRGCNTLTGSFSILEAIFDTSGVTPEIISLAARFEQHCEGGNPALLGILNFNVVDSDEDNLDDLWEIENFSSLDPNADDDPDGDTLSNSAELLLNSDPNQFDILPEDIMPEPASTLR